MCHIHLTRIFILFILITLWSNLFLFTCECVHIISNRCLESTIILFGQKGQHLCVGMAFSCECTGLRSVLDLGAAHTAVVGQICH